MMMPFVYGLVHFCSTNHTIVAFVFQKLHFLMRIIFAHCNKLHILCATRAIKEEEEEEKSCQADKRKKNRKFLS